MSAHVCPKCGGPVSCLAGESAHPDNWYCNDEKECGWRAWENRASRKQVSYNPLDNQNTENMVEGMVAIVSEKTS